MCKYENFDTISLNIESEILSEVHCKEIDKVFKKLVHE